MGGTRPNIKAVVVDVAAGLLAPRKLENVLE